MNERPSSVTEVDPGIDQGEVHDLTGLAHLDQRAEVGRVGVDRVDAQVAAATADGRPGLGEVGERSRRQVVDHLDGQLLGNETVDEVRTDESGTADHQGIGRPRLTGVLGGRRLRGRGLAHR